ncbi:MAG: NADPH-dependent F420 reductase [Acidobacteriota bacterium]
MQIGILGGTGNEGQGLALRWASRGIQVLMGSRDPAKAERIAGRLNEGLDKPLIVGLSNADAAEKADIVVSTLPHHGHRQTLEGLRGQLKGKLLMVATIVWPPGPLDRPSAAEEAQAALGSSVKVVAAFQTVSAGTLRAIDNHMEEDTLVLGDDPGCRRRAVQVISRSGIRAVEAGPLRYARIVEAVTGLLLKINKTYGVKSAGLRITGIEGS